jgi:hypothetical protein
LRNLKITEVSSVDKAANPGARIVLYKRDAIAPDADDTDDDAEVWLAAAWDYLDTADGAAEERRRYPRGCDAAEHAAFVQSIARRLRLRANNNNDEDGRDPYQPWTANDDDADGEQINDADAERVAATKSVPMTPLRRLVKSCGGVVPLCKQIIRDQETTISEHELTALIVEYAKAEHPDMSDAAAFSKAFGAASPAGETLRRAVAIAKGAPAPSPAHDDDDDIGGGADAMAELTRHAERLRAAQPSLSFQQAFARVYSDPQHAHLVRRERRQNNPVLKLAR